METLLMLSSALSPSISSSSNPNKNPPKPPKSTRIDQTSKKPKLAEPFGKPNGVVKMPTPPWIKGPLVVQESDFLTPSKPSKKWWKERRVEEKTFKALNRRESGVRGKKAMKKIIRDVEKMRGMDNLEETQEGNQGEFSLLDCFDQIGNGDYEKIETFGGKVMPWDREEERFILRRKKREKVEMAAETILDEGLLERLRREALKMRKWVKVKKAGVTEAVVDEIRLVWMREELAMVRFDVPLCRNMDRAKEILEMKTGGLVVWGKKDFLVVYRGCNYQSTSKNSLERRNSFSASNQEITSNALQADSNAGEPMRAFSEGSQSSQLVTGSLYEREADRLLEGLGPRYIDWWMRKPLPVDGDLLPEVVPGFKPPLRRCPPGTRAKLTDQELTYLRKLALPLPFHFVLGRNRGLQGLAAAILKLWEKSIIAKIAVKWGVPSTNNEQMADELKRLTGGVLILRNKYLIILFRGKDFLPNKVADLVDERERVLKRFQIFEEGERQQEIEIFEEADQQLEDTSRTGTLSEFQEFQRKFGELEKGIRELEIELEAEKVKLEREVKNQERKLSILNWKIEKSAKELSKLNWKPSERDGDIEILTNEERECLRKIGLKMSSSLVLGRRGIFDGVMEGLHQHWKFREVAKVITMQRVFSRVLYTAKCLEVESGGILVSIEKLKEGHAIIIYRGRNYRRPPKLITENLLNKREALQRSLEMQRLGSLKYFAYERERAISDLKHRLEELNKRREDYLNGS